jgi:ketosteroid isomerase-like protein
MTTREKLDLIKTYYEGCSARDLDAMLATLHDDVTHYFLSPNVGDKPVSGAERLADYWYRVQPRIQGRWVIDHIIGEGNEAVIEWSLYWTTEDDNRVATRGAEWYQFQDGRIREIRAYYQQHPATSELRDFDYTGRGYSHSGCESADPEPIRVSEGI